MVCRRCRRCVFWRFRASLRLRLAPRGCFRAALPLPRSCGAAVRAARAATAPQPAPVLAVALLAQPCCLRRGVQPSAAAL
jgi:hypothetical protein